MVEEVGFDLKKLVCEQVKPYLKNANCQNETDLFHIIGGIMTLLYINVNAHLDIELDNQERRCRYIQAIEDLPTFTRNIVTSILIHLIQFIGPHNLVDTIYDLISKYLSKNYTLLQNNRVPDNMIEWTVGSGAFLIQNFSWILDKIRPLVWGFIIQNGEKRKESLTFLKETRFDTDIKVIILVLQLYNSLKNGNVNDIKTKIDSIVYQFEHTTILEFIANTFSINKEEYKTWESVETDTKFPLQSTLCIHLNQLFVDIGNATYKTTDKEDTVPIRLKSLGPHVNKIKWEQPSSNRSSANPPRQFKDIEPMSVLNSARSALYLQTFGYPAGVSQHCYKYNLTVNCDKDVGQEGSISEGKPSQLTMHRPAVFSEPKEPKTPHSSRSLRRSSVSRSSSVISLLPSQRSASRIKGGAKQTSHS
jgi:hypothetical protein